MEVVRSSSTAPAGVVQASSTAWRAAVRIALTVPTPPGAVDEGGDGFLGEVAEGGEVRAVEGAGSAGQPVVGDGLCGDLVEAVDDLVQRRGEGVAG